MKMPWISQSDTYRGSTKVTKRAIMYQLMSTNTGIKRRKKIEELEIILFYVFGANFPRLFSFAFFLCALFFAILLCDFFRDFTSCFFPRFYFVIFSAIFFLTIPLRDLFSHNSPLRSFFFTIFLCIFFAILLSDFFRHFSPRSGFRDLTSRTFFRNFMLDLFLQF